MNLKLDLRTISKSLSLSILSFLLVAGVLYAATTIGTDVVTTGVLTVSGLSSLNGNASTTMLSMTGNLWVGGYATTTAASGNMSTAGNVSVGTTTTEFANELAASSVSATTTLALGSSSSTKGGCIQVEASTGAAYRLYVGDKGSNATTTPAGAGFVAVFEPGACK